MLSDYQLSYRLNSLLDAEIIANKKYKLTATVKCLLKEEGCKACDNQKKKNRQDSMTLQIM